MKCMKKSLLIGACGMALLGTGILMYNKVLSSKTKRQLQELEENMCKDFENMI